MNKKLSAFLLTLIFVAGVSMAAERKFEIGTVSTISCGRKTIQGAKITEFGMRRLLRLLGLLTSLKII